jgi:hypothetical protein
MNLLYTSIGDLDDPESQHTVEAWRRRHHVVETMPSERLTSYLRLDPASSLALVDAIVCAADANSGIVIDFNLRRPHFTFPLHQALALAEDARSLPETCAMRDGKKWRSLPFIILYNPASYEFNPYMLAETHAHLVRNFRPSYFHEFLTLRQIQEIVDTYQDRVLEDYRSFGILIRFEKGRAQISPALRKKDPRAESDYYYAAADRRAHKGWVTVKRDSDGLRHDIELFQYLLDIGASETKMHEFFEEHPAFLMQARLGIPISHSPTLLKPEGWIPDYTIHPILGPQVGNVAEVLELKGPGEKLLARRQHRGLSQKVNAAVDQVRDYERSFREPLNFPVIEKAFGYVPEKPNMEVLIGRIPKTSEDREIFELRQGELNVNVITYDEILQTQTDQVRRHGEGPYIVTGFP